MHVIGTAGHVDHGKSTLVQKLTGIDPDRFEEEKRRGLTIDLGFAWLRLPSGGEVGIVDVPGHERFIKNMLAGAGGVTICLFVVAANEGWMPQSAEHLAILDVLGVEAGVVALTKSDAVDKEMLELAAAEVEEHLAASSLAGAPIMACSSLTGEGLDELIQALDDVVAKTPPPPDVGRPRLWADRVFTIAGAGTVITGTLAGGRFATGDEVEIAPEGRRARIRSIQSHKKEVSEIGPGNRVALNLAGLQRQGARRGDAVVKPGLWKPTALIDVELRVLFHHRTGERLELSEKGAHLLYVGSAESLVDVKLLARDRLVSGEKGFAQLDLRDPLPVASGDRFVLRDAGRVLTLAGGVILDPLPERARRRDPRRLDLLQDLKDATPSEALTALVRAAGAVERDEALFRSGSPAVDGEVVAMGRVLVSPERFQALAGAVRETLSRHHSSRPLEQGMAREALRGHVGLDPQAFEALLEALPDVVSEGASVRLASHLVRLAPEQERARTAVLEKIESAGFSPPLAKDLDADAALLRALREGGDIVQIGDFYLTKEQAADAKARVTRRIEQGGPITVAEIRNLLDTSRKYAVPLCEWLDATGVTRRQGDVRVLGPNA